MSDQISRRDLFKRGTVLAVGMMAPPWLASVAKADMVRAAKGKPADPDTVLVVVELAGGNDGLNTLIPYSDPEYYRLRPTLGVKEDVALKLDDGMGMHPSLKGLSELFAAGKVAVIQGVGYPNPNRSHFRSMDIWQTASPDDQFKYGWIGRHFDDKMAAGALSPVTGLGLSVEKPRALTAAKASIPCFASLADIKSMVGNADNERLLREIQGKEAQAGTQTRTIQQASISALDAMAALQSKLDGYTPSGTYPADQFGNGFKQIAQLIATSPQTRVVYFRVGGFDTHSKQADSHAKLLQGFSDAVKAFQDEMEKIGKADKVITMAFSEFGRRAYENGSAGTDHGKAGPMFLIGKRIKGGMYGPRPDLQNLQDGDLGWKIDFRSVYATALDDWMGGDSKVVLGGTFEKLAMLK